MAGVVSGIVTTLGTCPVVGSIVHIKQGAVVIESVTVGAGGNWSSSSLADDNYTIRHASPPGCVACCGTNGLEQQYSLVVNNSNISGANFVLNARPSITNVPGNHPFNNVVASGTYVDPDNNGPIVVEVSVDGGAWQSVSFGAGSWSKVFPSGSLPVGQRTVSVRITDGCGLSATASAILTVQASLGALTQCRC